MASSERTTRRSLLAALGSSVTFLAGCRSLDGRDDTVTPVPTDELGSPTATPVDGIVVEDIRVRKAVRYSSLMGSGGVLTPADQQYVVATVRCGCDLAAESFGFVTESGRWRPGLPRTAGARTATVAGHGGGAVGSPAGPTGESFLVFELPSPLDVTAPRIEYGDGGLRWELSTSAADRLAAPSPEFSLRRLAVPESVQQGERLTVTLSVENTTDTDGRFLAALYWPTELIADDDEATIVERKMPGGSEATTTVDIGTEYTTNEPGSIPLRLRGHVTALREVSVTGTTTPA